MKKIICVIPCCVTVPSQFMMSLLSIVRETELPIRVHAITGCNISYLRNALMEKALEEKADYILTLDADQVYPPNTVNKLVEHINSGISVVGGLTLKRLNSRPLVFDFIYSVGYEMKQHVIVKGMTKCDAMGMGGIMMKPDVLETIGFPYFNSHYSENDKRQVADDSSFYRKCKDNNIDVWCDGNLKYGHLTTTVIGGT